MQVINLQPHQFFQIERVGLTVRPLRQFRRVNDVFVDHLKSLLEAMGASWLLQRILKTKTTLVCKKKMHMNMKCWVVRTLCLLPRTSWTATGECALSRPDGQNILWSKRWAGHLPLCDAPEILILMPRHNIEGRGSVLYFKNVNKIFEMHSAILT